MKRRLAVLTVVLLSVLGLAAVALAAASPAVTTGPASSVKDQSAVVNGTVNPNGSETTYYFQWGLTNSYGATGSTHSAGAGTKAEAVHETASGLVPGTVYHYRLVATSASGTSAGADRTFKTAGHPPPGVVTGPASQIGTDSATVTGVVNPNGQSTTWEFEYGPTTAYGYHTNAGTVPASSGPVSVAQALQQLQSGAIFHYQLLAVHGSAVLPQTGGDRIFMTFPSPRPVPKVTRLTLPRHARKQPWVYATFGSVHPPSSIPTEFACSSGYVAIRFFTGGRRVKYVLAALRPNCTYSAQTVFNHRPARGKNGVVTLHVLVHFRGNGYMAPADARAQTVTLR